MIARLILQIEPEIPGAIKSMLETNALFAIMFIIAVGALWAFWKILNKYLQKLEAESEQTKVLEEIKDELKRVKEEILRK
jgi:hypothetical protein